MTIFLGCAYSYYQTIKINQKKQKIFATKWLVNLPDGSRKTYQVTLYNTSKQTKYKTFLKNTKNSENETTYIQINSLEEVERLQSKSGTIKIKEKTKIPQANTFNLNINSEELCIDPNGFVNSNDNLFSNGPLDYFKIKQYLRNYFSKRLLEEKPETKKAEKKLKVPKPLEVNSPLITVSPTRTNFQKVKKQPISYCCNLKVLTGIILAIAALAITNFYNTKKFNV